MPEEFTLGLAEVDVAIERAGLPANWHPFEIRSAGATLDEHARIAAASWDAMCARGLADRDKLDSDVAHTLRAWTQPDVLVIVRALETESDHHVFYRATIGEGLGVFSELAPDGIRFTQSRPDRLIDLVTDTLPAYRPVPLRELTVTQRTNARPPRELADFSAWPLHRFGIFELSLRRGPAPLRPISSVSFVDNDGGRFLTFTDQLSPDERRLHVVPSDGSHLRRWLHESIAEHRGSRNP